MDLDPAAEFNGTVSFFAPSFCWKKNPEIEIPRFPKFFVPKKSDMIFLFQREVFLGVKEFLKGMPLRMIVVEDCSSYPFYSGGFLKENLLGMMQIQSGACLKPR